MGHGNGRRTFRLPRQGETIGVDVTYIRRRSSKRERLVTAQSRTPATEQAVGCCDGSNNQRWLASNADTDEITFEPVTVSISVPGSGVSFPTPPALSGREARIVRPNNKRHNRTRRNGKVWGVPRVTKDRRRGLQWLGSNRTVCSLGVIPGLSFKEISSGPCETG